MEVETRMGPAILLTRIPPLPESQCGPACRIYAFGTRGSGKTRGFDVKELVTVSVSLDGTTHQLARRQLPYFEEALAPTSVVRPSGCIVR